MSNVSLAALPLIVPFFGAAVFLSCSVTCCLYRRASRSYAVLSDRVAALEARPMPPMPQATVVPIYNVPSYPGVAQYRPAVVPYYTSVATGPQSGPRSLNL